jgi:RHS repeat-associated protein
VTEKTCKPPSIKDSGLYNSEVGLAREVSPNGAERRFVHDAFNQLRRVSLAAPSPQPGGTPVQTTVGLYDYDFEGRRIHRWSAAEELYYVYHGLNVVTEYDALAQPAAVYDFGLPGGLTQPPEWRLLGNRLHSGLSSGVSPAFPGAGARHLSGPGAGDVSTSHFDGLEAGGGLSGRSASTDAAWLPDFGPPGDLIRANFAAEGERFYFHDALGSTTMLASLAPPPAGGSPVGTPAARYDYDPWGTQLNTPQPSSNRVNFTTYRHDHETSVEYAMARYYYTGTWRFLAPDPLRSDRLGSGLGRRLRADGFEWGAYVYCSGQPLSRTDPTGLFTPEAHIRIAITAFSDSASLDSLRSRDGFDERGFLFWLIRTASRIPDGALTAG